MKGVIYIPSFDSMPALGSLPEAMHPAIGRLSQVGTVQDVVAMQEEGNITFFVKFKGEQPEYRKALQCFRGLRPLEYRQEGLHNYMQLKLRN